MRRVLSLRNHPFFQYIKPAEVLGKTLHNSFQFQHTADVAYDSIYSIKNWVFPFSPDRSTSTSLMFRTQEALFCRKKYVQIMWLLFWLRREKGRVFWITHRISKNSEGIDLFYFPSLFFSSLWNEKKSAQQQWNGKLLQKRELEIYEKKIEFSKMIYARRRTSSLWGLHCLQILVDSTRTLHLTILIATVTFPLRLLQALWNEDVQGEVPIKQQILRSILNKINGLRMRMALTSLRKSWRVSTSRSIRTKVIRYKRFNNGTRLNFSVLKF